MALLTLQLPRDRTESDKPILTDFGSHETFIELHPHFRANLPDEAFLIFGMKDHEAHNDSMRTTIKLDGEAGDIVQLYADSHAISVSEAISELVLQAVQPKMRIKYIDGIPVFDIPQGRTIRDQEVRSALAEEL